MLSGLYLAWTVKGQGIGDKLKSLLNYNGKSLPLLFFKMNGQNKRRRLIKSPPSMF